MTTARQINSLLQLLHGVQSPHFEKTVRQIKIYFKKYAIKSSEHYIMYESLGRFVCNFLYNVRLTTSFYANNFTVGNF